MNPTRHYLTTVLATFAVASACTGGVDATVAPDASAVLAISPRALNLVIGTEGQLTARAVDSKGRKVAAPLAWSSADPTIASVRMGDGTVTAISAGTTTITAIAGVLRATATVSVRLPEPPATVVIPSIESSLLVGEMERLIARAYDFNGRTTGASFDWSSSDPTVATVGKSDGIVTAVSIGTTRVTATVGSLRATATVSVAALSRSLSFTRRTELAGGEVSFDVLSFSPADQSLRSLRRPARFAFIAAPAWSVDTFWANWSRAQTLN